MARIGPQHNPNGAHPDGTGLDDTVEMSGRFT